MAGITNTYTTTFTSDMNMFSTGFRHCHLNQKMSLSSTFMLVIIQSQHNSIADNALIASYMPHVQFFSPYFYYCNNLAPSLP